MINFQGYIEYVQLDAPDSVMNEYPLNIPCIQKLKKLSFHPRVTFLIGENGMGKSTLMEAIAVPHSSPQLAIVRYNPSFLRSDKI